MADAVEQELGWGADRFVSLLLSHLPAAHRFCLLKRSI
jgi:hypothetical protein